ncbi:hypothetical protein QBC37DRAFT_403761 [Rhypophila decipiens]|uniref:Uncharacterized protein n=1 Tax=Rhypophila decipiens TaxID=261697 RepID=A0AAN7B6N6_9PEZI|nr:hypothetical protein QBC37DRAFT_403761 [Rhypophila decipiens]
MFLTLRLVAAALLFPPSTLAARSYNYTENVLTHPPNETRSITFKPFPDDPDLKNSEWTWRVNITDTPTPGQQINYPFFFSDNTPLEARGLVVTWDLVWPKGGVLSETLSQNAPTICASMPFTLTFLPKVTNLWPEENTDSPDCAPVLGQACVDTILANGKVHKGPERSCSLATPWDKLPECKDKFKYIYDKDRSGWGGTISGGIDSLESGESFASYANTYDGKDTSIYEAAVNMLQIVLLHSLPPSPAFQNMTQREPFLACMRVKTDKLPVEEEGDGGRNAAPGGTRIDWLVACSTLGLAIIMALGL